MYLCKGAPDSPYTSHARVLATMATKGSGLKSPSCPLFFTACTATG
jgi:hypothetical protein